MIQPSEAHGEASHSMYLNSLHCAVMHDLLKLLSCVLWLFPSRPKRRWHGRSPRWLSTTSSTSRTITARSSPPRYKSLYMVFFFPEIECVEWLLKCLFLSCPFTVMTPIEEPKGCHTLQTVYKVPLTKNWITLRTNKAFYLLLNLNVCGYARARVCVCLGTWVNDFSRMGNGNARSTSLVQSSNTMTL